MTVEEVLTKYDLDNSVLIGYYGGGNYGDELLLEALANMFKTRGLKHIAIAYQNMSLYPTYHHDFGFQLVEMSSKPALLRAISRNKNIIIGGGGLWGLDVNLNIFMLSTLLFFSRWLLGKRVYLLGVGYYNSTTLLGRVSAWLAGKSATYIVARDQESHQNFRKISEHVGLGRDIAWLISSIDLTPYRQDVAKLDALLPIKHKTLFITLRRFRPNQENNYANEVGNYLAKSQGQDIIVALMEPRAVDGKGYKLIQSWKRAYKNVSIADFVCNPVALYSFFQKHQDKLALIGPHFHIIITAHLNHVPFLPIYYDNKVSALFKQIGKAKALPIDKVKQSDIRTFANEFYGGF